MAFINRTHELAAIFTQPAWHNPQLAGKYLPSGMKPVEEFVNDIMSNLQSFAVEGDTVFYRTPDYWYMFQKVGVDVITGNPSDADSKVVWMTRYRNGSWERMDDWANLHTVELVGKSFLNEHRQKRVHLFDAR